LCCGQFAKRYSRKLSALMARWLIALVRLSPKGEYVHLDAVFATIAGPRGSNANDYCYLERWALIEPAPPDAAPSAGKPGKTGLWRPTDKGRAFVRGDIAVPSTVFMYAGQDEGFTEDLLTVRQALATKFDYAELMGA
jgi:hypothetical protein